MLWYVHYSEYYIFFILPLNWLKIIFLIRNVCYCLKNSKEYIVHIFNTWQTINIDDESFYYRELFSDFMTKMLALCQKKDTQDYENPYYNNKIILETKWFSSLERLNHDSLSTIWLLLTNEHLWLTLLSNGSRLWLAVNTSNVPPLYHAG